MTNATGTTLPTPTSQFRRVADERSSTGFRLNSLDENGQLLPCFHWLKVSSGGGYNVIQNADGDCWTTDENGWVYFYGGKSPVQAQN